jgi:hypothetical protein
VAGGVTLAGWLGVGVGVGVARGRDNTKGVQASGRDR